MMRSTSSFHYLSSIIYIQVLVNYWILAVPFNSLKASYCVIFIMDIFEFLAQHQSSNPYIHGFIIIPMIILFPKDNLEYRPIILFNVFYDLGMPLRYIISLMDITYRIIHRELPILNCLLLR